MIDPEDYDLQAGSLGLTPEQVRSQWLTVPRGRSILVVGPDRVGKTTLVQHLSRMMHIPSFKCPSEKQIFKQGGRSSLTFDYMLTHFLRQTGMRFISDRGYPCEWVYSHVFRRETDIDLLREIDNAHADIGTIILHVTSSVPPVEEDDLVSKEDYGKVWQTYGQFCNNWTNCQVVKVDTARMLQAFQDGGDISKAVAEEVMEMLE